MHILCYKVKWLIGDHHFIQIYGNPPPVHPVFSATSWGTFLTFCRTWTTCFHTSSVLRALRRRLPSTEIAVGVNSAQTPTDVAVTWQVSKNADVLGGYLAWLLRVPLIPRRDFCQLCWEISLANHREPGFQECGGFSECPLDISPSLQRWGIEHNWILPVHDYWPHMLHLLDMQLAIRLHNSAFIPGCLCRIVWNATCIIIHNTH